MRRALVITLALVACLPSLASAYYRTGGSGAGSAGTATLGVGNQPTGSVSGTTVTVTWVQTSFGGQPLGGYTGGGYRVFRSPAAGGTAIAAGGTCASVVSGAAASLSCDDTNVAPGQWRYSVRPLLNSWTGADSPLSLTQSINLAAPVLAALTRLDPGTTQTTGALKLDWSAVTGATGYDVYRDGASTPLNGATPITGTTYTDSTLPNSGGPYSYVVRARTGTLESPNSNSQPATPYRRLAAPTTVSTSLAAAARVDVNWSSVTGASGYNVYRRLASGSTFTPLNGSPVSGTTYADLSATSGTAYVYRVFSVAPGATAAGLESLVGTDSASVTPDGTSPTVTLADPGSPLRGTVTLNATAADTGGSGIDSIRFERAPTTTSNWVTICNGSATTCSFNTTGATDGSYDLRAVATDVAGNTATSSAVLNRRIDNTAPTGTTTVAATNRAGGTLGRPEQGDILGYTYSEALAPDTVLSGWTGASTPVTVRITQAGTNNTVTVLNGAAQLTALGSIATGRNYVTLTSNFNTSAMTMSGSTISITLGTLAIGGVVATDTTVGDLTWTIPAGTTATDLAGNLLAGGTFVEGDNDADF